MIGKVCKAFEIPKPYLGYWAKLANGKKPKKTPLLKNDDPELQSLTFHRHADYEATVNEPPRELQYDSGIQEMLRRANELGPVKVSDSLRNPHRLVSTTKEHHEKSIQESKSPYSQRNYSSRESPKKRLSIDVTEQQRRRAYRVMDALIKRIEAVGGEVRIEEPTYRHGASETKVVFGDEIISAIRLREKHNQKRITNPDAKYSWDRNRTELVPSGLLLIDDGPGSYRSPLAMDGKLKKLEDKLENLVIDFVRQAGEARIRRRREEELERIRAEEERIRRELEAELRRRQDALDKRKADEAGKVQQLVDHASYWHKTQQLRDYLDALCLRSIGDAGVVQIDSELADYLRWGFDQADRMDPLRPSPHSVLDEEVDDSDLRTNGDFIPRKPR